MGSDWFQLAVGVLGGLGVFLYGMRVMSQGLESVGGPKMRQWLQSLTTHPIAGVFTGIFVTCLIQSSSATTVMLVSLTHAGFLNLTQAIGVIMGANIGTTMTGWIVAILGFEFKISNFALPAVATGVVFIFMGSRRRIGQWGEILVGFGLLFLGLMFMQESVAILRKSPAIGAMLQAYTASSGFFALLLCVVIGAAVTVIIQSSSATMALTITLAFQGLIDFPTAAALILGENIGTTITANLAAMTTGLSARRAARAHMVFNLVGVVWAVILFSPMLRLVDWLVPGDPFSPQIALRSIAIGSHMAAFHTVFNVINTLLFLPFIGLLATFVTRLVPGEEKSEDRHMLYIETQLVSTPELALTATRKELQRMAQHAMLMFDTVIRLFDQGSSKAKELAEQVARYEEVIDALEREITEYLAVLIQHPLATETSEEIAACMNMAHNFEKIGDHCESLLRSLRRKYDNKISFTDEGKQEIHSIAAKVRDSLAIVEKNITNYEANVMNDAQTVEADIDRLRGELRDAHIARIIDGRCDANAGLIFIDMLTSFEKIGDHAFNVAQYISHARDK